VVFVCVMMRHKARHEHHCAVHPRPTEHHQKSLFRDLSIIQNRERLISSTNPIHSWRGRTGVVLELASSRKHGPLFLPSLPQFKHWYEGQRHEHQDTIPFPKGHIPAPRLASGSGSARIKAVAEALECPTSVSKQARHFFLAAAVYSKLGRGVHSVAWISPAGDHLGLPPLLDAACA
jgi:hypothetical protein